METINMINLYHKLSKEDAESLDNLVEDLMPTTLEELVEAMNIAAKTLKALSK